MLQYYGQVKDETKEETFSLGGMSLYEDNIHTRIGDSDDDQGWVIDGSWTGTVGPNNVDIVFEDFTMRTNLTGEEPSFVQVKSTITVEYHISDTVYESTGGMAMTSHSIQYPSSNGLSAGAITGIVIGSIAGATLLGAGSFYIWKSKQA